MVENTFKELDIDGLNLTWKAFDNVTSSGFFQHFHDFYEVLYFVKAKADYIIENNVYPVSDGDIILISPGKYHFLSPGENQYYERLVFHFSPKILMQANLLPQAFEKTEYLKKSEHPELASLMDKLINKCNHFSDEHLITQARMTLTDFLMSLLYVTVSDDSTYTISDKISNDAIKYIADNLASIQCIDDISNALFISRSTLQHAFKTSMQVPIMKFVRNKKIVIARTLIQNGSSPSEAAEAVGFNEYSTFFRCYKNYFGHPPKNEH